MAELAAVAVGFCPGRQPMEVVGFLHRAICRPDEWGLPLVVLSIGVPAAVDCLVPRHATDQLHTLGASLAQVAAVLREMVGARAQPRVGNVTGPWQTLEKGTRQVGSRSPELWSHAIAGPLHSAHEHVEALRRSPGLRSSPVSRCWSGRTTSSLCPQVGRTVSSGRARAYEAALAGLDLTISPSSVETKATESVPAPEEELCLASGPVQKRNTLVVRGVASDPTGSTATMVDNRLKEAEKVANPAQRAGGPSLQDRDWGVFFWALSCGHRADALTM